MGLQLYAITNAIIEAQHEHVNTDELNALAIQFDEKLVACSHVVKNLDAETKAIETEIDRLRAMREARQQNSSRLKAYMLQCMKHAGLEKVKVGHEVIRIQKNSRMTIAVTDKDVIPARFIKKTVTVSVDKSAVEAEVKETGEIPPGLDVTHGEHLRIQ